MVIAASARRWPVQWHELCMVQWETKLDYDTSRALERIAAKLRVSRYQLTRIALLAYLLHWNTQTKH